MLFKFLDYTSAITIICGLFNVQKHKNWWLVYIVGNLLFVTLNIHSGLYGMVVMGGILTLIGIKNYINYNKNEKR
jgi:nicotinamide riboside transporter PnuC